MKSASAASPRIPQRFSLVAETVESLCDGIRHGLWKGHLPGERKLCETLQVSRRTLRSALDELQHRGWIEVTGRKRRRIKTAHARRSRRVQKKVIGILTPGSYLSLPSRISFVVDTLRAKLTAAGYDVHYHISPSCYTGNPGRALAQFTAEHPATMWIVLSAHEPIQRWLARQGISCLILGSCVPGISLPSVDIDFHAACNHAGGLLWRKGHRRIALVLPRSIYGGDIASEEGLREALRHHPDAHVQTLRHDNTPSHLCSLIDECLRLPDYPTAYVVGGATHVLTVMMHLMRRGVRIPRDVSVISRDNDPILDATSPLVTRYAIPPEQLANRISLAVRQLVETGLLPSGGGGIRLMPEFVPGESL